MAKTAVKAKKRAKPAKGKKHHRGVLDLPKAVETRMAEGRAQRESVPLEAHGEWAAFDGRPDPIGILEKQDATRVPELVPEEIAKKSHFKLDQSAPVAKVEDLASYDAIIVGAGTRFGRLSSQMANFLDQAGGLWARGALNGKVGGAFTSTATQHGGQETTLFSIITNLLHFGMVVVGLDYGHAGQMTLEEITGGSPYGATTIAGGDGRRQPTANELTGARYQGRKIAETANKLHG